MNKEIFLLLVLPNENYVVELIFSGVLMPIQNQVWKEMPHIFM